MTRQTKCTLSGSSKKKRLKMGASARSRKARTKMAPAKSRPFWTERPGNLEWTAILPPKSRMTLKRTCLLQRQKSSHPIWAASCLAMIIWKLFNSARKIIQQLLRVSKNNLKLFPLWTVVVSKKQLLQPLGRRTKTTRSD